MKTTALVMLLFAIGCSSSDEPEANNSALVEIVRIELTPDGPVERARVTLAERDTLTPDRGIGSASNAITVDNPCNSHDLKLYTGIFFSGSTLCLTGVGTLHLATVSLGTGNWTNRVRSYKTNDTQGRLLYDDTDLDSGTVRALEAAQFCDQENHTPLDTLSRSTDRIELAAHPPGC